MYNDATKMGMAELDDMHKIAILEEIITDTIPRKGRKRILHSISKDKRVCDVMGKKETQQVC